MKTLLGVLLLSLAALCKCSDTQADKNEKVKALNYCQDSTQSYCLDAIENTPPISVTDIPPVGCAIPIAQIEKAWQAR